MSALHSGPQLHSQPIQRRQPLLKTKKTILKTRLSVHQYEASIKHWHHWNEGSPWKQSAENVYSPSWHLAALPGYCQMLPKTMPACIIIHMKAHTGEKPSSIHQHPYESTHRWNTIQHSPSSIWEYTQVRKSSSIHHLPSSIWEYTQVRNLTRQTS